MNAREAILFIYRPTTTDAKWTRNETIIKMSGRNRSNIKAGVRVRIVQKRDQRTGKLTDGIVKDILTKSPTHPHGIKVRLTSGIVGRVKVIGGRTAARDGK